MEKERALVALLAGAMGLIGCSTHKNEEGEYEGITFNYGFGSGSGFNEQVSYRDADGVRFSTGVPLGNQTTEDVSSE